MYLRTLQPIRDYDKYSKDLKKILEYQLWISIYKPLIELLSPDVKHNAKLSVLIQAFIDRKIYFDSGFVYGSFSASISKALIELGGRFNNTKKAFKINLSQFPPEIRDALARGSMVEKEAINKMVRKVQELGNQNIVIPGTEEQSKNTLTDLHRQFEKVTPEDLEIPVALHDYKEEQMIRDYTTNIHRSIEDVSAEMTYRLRQRVQDAVGQGMRAEKLKQVLKVEYGIAANKAKFIARQETSLFTAQYRQIRYEDAGINEYQWSTSHDERVREDHKLLNGMIFRWDDPPITNRITGNKNNPGEDWGCRCVALPVIRQAGTGKNLLETEEHQLLHR